MTTGEPDGGHTISDPMELRAVRAEVAHDKGVPPKHRHRLTGSTREEIEADADQLLVDIGHAPAGER